MEKSAHNTITATELVRNLSGAIDKVRMTGHTLYITKGSQTVAKLSPPPKLGLPINKLHGLLKSLQKPDDDVSVMAKDLGIIRRQSNLPENPWA